VSSSLSLTIMVLCFGSLGFGSFVFFKASLAEETGRVGSLVLNEGSKESHSAISNDGGFFNGQSRYHAQVSR
jgi:hypothetical protein